MRSIRFVFAIGILTSSALLAEQKVPPIPPEFELLNREAKEHFERGDYAKAEVTFRKMMEQAPDNIRFRSNLAVTLFRRSKYTEAEEHLKKVLTLAPEDLWSHRILGIVYYAKGDQNLARKSLEEAIRINPKDAIAHNYLGINASQRGTDDQAVDELKTAIALDGSYSDAYFNLAVVLVIKRKPDTENARAYYERALKLGAEPDQAMEQLLGWVDENGIRTPGKPLTPEIVNRLRSMLLARR